MRTFYYIFLFEISSFEENTVERKSHVLTRIKDNIVRLNQINTRIICKV